MEDETTDFGETKLYCKMMLTFRFSQFKFTFPDSNFSARPSSSGSAMNVSLFLLFVVYERKKYISYDLNKQGSIRCMENKILTSEKHLTVLVSTTVSRNATTGSVVYLEQRVKVSTQAV